MMTGILRSTSAAISPDGLYRWMLGREFEHPGRTALWVGVNPSTADAEQDDQSIRKLYGFGERLGISKWLVGNLFAYRATDVNELARATDPIGARCDEFLEKMTGQADVVIAGWGRVDKVPQRLRHRVDDVANRIVGTGKNLMCWGTCQDGSPRHPLMVPYSQPLEVWL
jgi:hypothetical protein